MKAQIGRHPIEIDRANRQPHARLRGDDTQEFERLVASRKLKRLTPNCSASTVSVGNRSPGFKPRW